MPYDQNNPTADNTTTDHSYSNSNSSASSQNASQSSSNASSTANRTNQWQAVPRTWTDRSAGQRQGSAESAGNGVSESNPHDKMAAWLAEGQQEMAWDGVGYIRSEGGHGR